MKLRSRSISVLGLTSLVAAAAMSTASAFAHHAFAAVFNENASVDLIGTVTKVEWMNPHTWFYIDVEDPDGTVQSWALEMGSPSGLVRIGWTRSTLNVGAKVRVTGYQAKDDSMMASVKSVALADGRELSGLSSK